MTKNKYEKEFYLVTWVWIPTKDKFNNQTFPNEPFMTWKEGDYTSGYVPHKAINVVKKFETSLEAAKYANYLKETPDNTEISISKNVISLYSKEDMKEHDAEIENNKNLYY
jgi:hypothetical protein